MAKFRRNHTHNGKVFSSTFIRVIAFFFIAAFIMYFINRGALKIETVSEYEVPVSEDKYDRFFLPEWPEKEVVNHKFYSLAYNEKHEQADWVAYELTKDQLLIPNVKRAREFRPDYSVPTRSAYHRDYTGSGYTRGHLAPAGDMAFSKEAMQESFFMSNMSPQLAAFNGGIWRELEENVRNWAFRDERVFVVTGPVLNQGIIKKIGKNRVSVPSLFYKIVLDLNGNERKGIGFVIPNERSDKHLSNYAVTIDSVETLTGIDFFSNLMDETMEANLESEIDISEWTFDPKKFANRNKRF